MKKFLTRLLIFICPIIIFFSIPLYVLWKSKDNFYVIDKLVVSNKKYLLGYAYDETQYKYLKWIDITSNSRKTVWTLGSSRVLQFRRQMFDSTFYNAGYTIYSLNDFRPFLKSIPVNKYPKYLVIALDEWMFNTAWDDLTVTSPVDTWQDSYRIWPQSSTYLSVYKDLFAHKYSFSTIKNDGPLYKVGLNALVNNTGFRTDGSLFYGGQIDKLVKNDKTARDFKYAGTLGRIKHGNERFQYGNSINPKALVEVDALLNYCKQHQIQVIAFLPPFAEAVYDKMMATNKYGYLKQIYPALKPIFNKYHYEVYDFSRVSLVNADDHETIDGFHGGEGVYQKIMINMLNQGSVLNQVSNVKRLQADLLKKKNNYVVYGY